MGRQDNYEGLLKKFRIFENAGARSEVSAPLYPAYSIKAIIQLNYQSRLNYTLS